VPAAEDARRIIRRAAWRPRAVLRRLWAWTWAVWRGWMMAGVANRYQQDRREPDRRPLLFQRVRPTTKGRTPVA
jgi:hypothetical protein